MIELIEAIFLLDPLIGLELGLALGIYGACRVVCHWIDKA